MKQITNKLGIWMDHANAYMTEFTIEPMTTTTLESGFTHQDKIESMLKSEALSHHKEQHEQAAYYKQLIEIMSKYSHVILFGPTNAKSELHNLIKEIPHMDNIKVDIKNTDKMNEHEQQAFVKNFFSNNIHKA
jgi:stalled ribosome rescue protein Dom34